MSALLSAENIVKKYANHLALDNVSVSVEQGCIHGLLGPNGAGKTTLIRIINQITALDSGQVWFDGRPIQPKDVQKIGYLPEERGLYKKMQVGEQAVYLARLKGLSHHDAVAQLKIWFDKFGIGSWWNRKVEELSKGMAQKVQFIVTILHRPKLLIFDEPFSGFDPVNANLLKQEILALKDQGSTIIFSTHNMASVEELCDYITLINKSKNILSGATDEVRRKHGSNVVEIGYTNKSIELQPLLPEGYTFVSEEQKGGIRLAKVACSSSSDCNVLLQKIMSQVEVKSYNEIIPSMNDIFIKMVS
ncbi:MAG: ATP-binding cassette domain-containing protein [Prevotellaceae bacterium]|jgi:ABC-2 type transport system ATP-binding protein|nr:ATP-binding cassette domain-containing protein [Prevotellaceae bacterium]